MGHTRTAIVFTLAIFYTALFLVLGASGDFLNSAGFDDPTMVSESKQGFFGNIVTSILSFPGWLNIIIFTPLTILIGYMLLSLVSPGGGD